MNLNLDVFYSEDISKKLAYVQELFECLYQQAQAGERLLFGKMSFKTLVRVLTDDYKKSPDLTLATLKLIHLLLSHSEESDRLDIVAESPVEVFMMTATKILSWEARRTGRIYSRYQSLNKNETEFSGKDRINDSAAVTTFRTNDQVGKENKTAKKKDEVKGNIQKDIKVIRTMNINLRKQARTLTIIVMILREYRMAAEGSDFNGYLITLGVLPHLARCLDHEDPLLIRSTVLFLTETINSKVAEELISNNVLTRVSRLLNCKDCSYVAVLCRELLKWPVGMKAVPLAKEVLTGLEKGAISQSLSILNCLASGAAPPGLLESQGAHIYLLGLGITCFKSIDTAEGKKPLWNLLVNLACSPTFADQCLQFSGFEQYFDFYLKTGSTCCLKFLENVFWFSKSLSLKFNFRKYGDSLYQRLENQWESKPGEVAGLINVLAEVYGGTERKPITLMMKILKRGSPHPSVFIAAFNFLNNALISLPGAPELISSSVSDYSIKHFFKPQPNIEPEVKVQFLFFLANLVLIKNINIDKISLNAYIDSIEVCSLRLGTLVLNFFDVFLLQARNQNENTKDIIRTKQEYFSRLLQRMNQTSYLAEQNC